MKTNLSYPQALEIADRCLAYLRPFCERIEIAGSIRRQKAVIGDIELVCVPKTECDHDLFGNTYPPHSILTNQVAAGLGHVVKGGPNFKQIVLPEITLDLFITTPEQWGVIFTIRTGSAEFSHKLVTNKRFGGFCPSHLKFSEGRVWSGSQALDTPEEADLFAALSLKFVPPVERNL